MKFYFLSSIKIQITSVRMSISRSNHNFTFKKLHYLSVFFLVLQISNDFLLFELYLLVHTKKKKKKISVVI